MLVQEHPGWTAVPAGALRFMRVDRAAVWLRWEAQTGGLSYGAVTDAGAKPGPAVDRRASAGIASDSVLGEALERLGQVRRVRNADLWDAIGTAVIRQVVRAGQARDMYQLFCQLHGESLISAAGSGFLFPDAEKVAGLAREAFDEAGMAFKRPALQAAAAAYLAHGPQWRAMQGSDLVAALQAVPRIGPWTAGAAVADFTGDFSLYPYTDLAVRTWARRAAPDIEWPSDEAAFGSVWRDLAGDRLSDLTLLTLAWGDNHARAQQPRGRPRPRP
ncbi:hypothetical protein [Paractinoplanes globisporus]|uniref:DNA-3-methyladenine glycosylase II n=1 Tax=Paractinoplanes globisporus TaxID=113565 RepID=A0ABW6WFV0_9ACTN|nr:hypothetical protein [Actinoplanes globisporus]